MTIAGGILAFALVVVLLVPVERDELAGLSRPLSTDRGPAGLAGLARWLDEGGVATDTLTRRYSTLASSLELGPRGNLLVMSLPQLTPSRAEELDALRTWIAQGNTALVLIAAGDAPRWSWGGPRGGSDALLDHLGFTFGTTRTDPPPSEVDGEASTAKTDEADPWQAIEGEPIALGPRIRHPLTRGVDTVATRSRRVLDRGWRLAPKGDGRMVLALLDEPEGGAAFWEARVGDGRLWVSRYSDLFSNAGLGQADNARFVANLLATSLGRNGRVIFDDMHQGATDLYDPKAFFSDPRFMNTMIVVVGFWLLYLVGRSRRLAPAREGVHRYYAADLARAMAGFFVRRLSPVTVERQLFEFFFNEIRGRYGLPTNGQPVWSMLSGMSRVPDDDVNALRSHYERASTGTKSNLVALARLMQRTRENVS